MMRCQTREEAGRAGGSVTLIREPLERPVVAGLPERADLLYAFWLRLSQDIDVPRN